MAASLFETSATTPNAVYRHLCAWAVKSVSPFISTREVLHFANSIPSLVRSKLYLLKMPQVAREIRSITLLVRLSEG